MPSIHSVIRRIPGPIKQAIKERVYPELLLEGQLAPEWHLQNWDGSWHRMRKDKWSIMVLYPGDDTPGCTRQLQEFQSEYARLQELDAEVYGINPAEADSHKAFAEKFGFDFPILTDRGASVCTQFRCSLPIPYASNVIRTVYLVNPERKIRLANRGAPPVEAIIRSIQALKASPVGM